MCRAIRVSDYRVFQAAKRPATPTSFSSCTIHHRYAVTDKPESVFTIAKEPPQRRYISYNAQPSIGTDGETFRIVPKRRNWQSPPAEIFFQ